MNKLLALEPHLTVEQLGERYRDAESPRVKSHWHVLWRRAPGKRTSEVAAITGFKPAWIRQLVRRYNTGGPAAMQDYIKFNGRQPYLTPAQIRQLATALRGPAPDGGRWSSAKVARWIEEQTGRRGVWVQTGWSYMVSASRLPETAPAEPLGDDDEETEPEPTGGSDRLASGI